MDGWDWMIYILELKEPKDLETRTATINNETNTSSDSRKYETMS